jgi:hypothetical protein
MRYCVSHKRVQRSSRAIEPKRVLLATRTKTTLALFDRLSGIDPQPNDSVACRKLDREKCRTAVRHWHEPEKQTLVTPRSLSVNLNSPFAPAARCCLRPVFYFLEQSGKL